MCNTLECMILVLFFIFAYSIICRLQQLFYSKLTDLKESSDFKKSHVRSNQNEGKILVCVFSGGRLSPKSL